MWTANRPYCTSASKPTHGQCLCRILHSIRCMKTVVSYSLVKANLFKNCVRTVEFNSWKFICDACLYHECLRKGQPYQGGVTTGRSEWPIRNTCLISPTYKHSVQRPDHAALNFTCLYSVHIFFRCPFKFHKTSRTFFFFYRSEHTYLKQENANSFSTDQDVLFFTFSYFYFLEEAPNLINMLRADRVSCMAIKIFKILFDNNIFTICIWIRYESEHYFHTNSLHTCIFIYVIKTKLSYWVQIQLENLNAIVHFP